MGKNNANSWLNAVKKAFRSPTSDDEKRSSSRRDENEQQEEEKKRGKKRWLFRRFSLETTIQHNAGKCADSKAVRVCSGEENLVRKQPKTENSAATAFAMAMATTAAAEAAVATAQAAVEIVRLTRPALLVKEEKAALLIQKIFRGYLARKALLALRGVVKLQALIRGHNVRKRAKMTLQCIQSLVRVQALVCDQRRRLSCEAMSLGSIISHDNSERKSMSRNTSRVSSSLEADPSGLEEIHALIQKVKECSLIQGQTLAHALSQQIWTRDEDQSSDKLYENEQYSGRKTVHSWIRKDRNLCNQRDSIKTVQVDTSRPYSFTPPTKPRDHEQYLDHFQGKHLNLYVESPRTPSSSRTKSIPCSPCYHQGAETPNPRSLYIHRMSMSDNSRPNYMAATASAKARVRPCSTPRQRGSSPSRELAGSARKRLSFPVHDGLNADDKTNFQRCRGNQFGDEQSSDKPYYATD